MVPMSGGSPSTAGMLSQQPPGQPNSILRVIIENMIYPITIDVLHQVISGGWSW